MVGGTDLDPSRETNLDLLHVAASCHMLCMLHHVALSCRRRLRRYYLLKGRDCLVHWVCHTVSSDEHRCGIP